MNSSQPQDFPWQTVYDERLGLGGDVAWMEEHIRHLRYTADQLEPRLAAMRLRLNHLHDVTEYNENRAASLAGVDAAMTIREQECVCAFNRDNLTDYTPCPVHDKSPGYAEGRVAGLEAANGALLSVLNFWREGPQSADMQALLADVQRVYDFNKAEAGSIDTSGADS